MALTLQQQQTLKTYILSVPELAAQPMNSDGADAIATAIRQPAVPAFTVWKTNVSVDEIMRNGMNWTLVDGITVGKARIWEWMSRLGTIDVSKLNIRAGIDEAWKGIGTDMVTQRANIYTHCKRDATITEKLFATGTGTVASPATMGFEGSLSWQDVEAARAV
ncbi:MAG: hypothetical protein IPO08_21600 [Xanthomonadales bacterium]|nr:hypothetical protein [Xanthomonadales bacterium]